MNYARESLDLPPFALAAIAGGSILGGIIVISAAIVRELAVHWFGNEVSR